jgi:nucleotide-binding universal stress UspA family protein
MTVVVGVDGMPESLAAIRLARQEAAYRGTDLVAVMAYSDNAAMGAPAVRPLSSPRTLQEQRELAEATLRGVVRNALAARTAPGTGAGTGAGDDQVRILTVAGLPGRVLVETARELDAELVVLASRKGRSPSRLLGAVSQYVLRNAPCPVLVVPA